MRQVVLDTETTGLETSAGHRVIEIGCIELNNRRITGNTFHQYINPERDIDQEAEQIHGISQQFLADKPKFAQIVADFIDFIRDVELVIHNADFDVGFLQHEFKLANIKPANIIDYCSVIDTLKLARTLHPGKRNSLDALCKRYQVDNKHREWHGALLDAELLAQVYLSMTGGQSSLFSEQQQSQQVSVQQRQSQNYQQTAVIYATEQELAQHNRLLKMMNPTTDISS